MNSPRSNSEFVCLLPREKMNVKLFDKAVRENIKGKATRRLHCALSEDGLASLAANGISLSKHEHFEEFFYGTKENDLLLKNNIWYYKRVFRDRVEYVLQVEVNRLSSCVLQFETFSGEATCKAKLAEKIGAGNVSRLTILAYFDTFRYRPVNGEPWWIDMSRFREDKWYATVNFDLGPSTSVESFPIISSMLSDYSVPSKVIAYLHLNRPGVLSSFPRLDVGDSYYLSSIALLKECPLSTDLPDPEDFTLDDYEGTKSLPQIDLH